LEYGFAVSQKISNRLLIFVKELSKCKGNADFGKIKGMFDLRSDEGRNQGSGSGWVVVVVVVKWREKEREVEEEDKMVIST